MCVSKLSYLTFYASECCQHFIRFFVYMYASSFVWLWCCAVDLVAARIKIIISKLLKLKIVEIVGLLVSLIRSLRSRFTIWHIHGYGVDRLGRFRVVNISTFGVRRLSVFRSLCMLCCCTDCCCVVVLQSQRCNSRLRRCYRRTVWYRIPCVEYVRVEFDNLDGLLSFGFRKYGLFVVVASLSCLGCCCCENGTTRGDYTRRYILWRLSFWYLSTLEWFARALALSLSLLAEVVVRLAR